VHPVSLSHPSSPKLQGFSAVVLDIFHCFVNSPSHDSVHRYGLTDACIPHLYELLVHPESKLTLLSYVIILYNCVNSPTDDSVKGNRLTDGCVPALYEALKHPNCRLETWRLVFFFFVIPLCSPIYYVSAFTGSRSRTPACTSSLRRFGTSDASCPSCSRFKVGSHVSYDD
jgi:hypothetical protein